ncbi:MAG: hypothetical protein U0W40_02020 [Acidimicrobiia bacterium]
MEEALVSVTAHDVDDAALIVVHVHHSTAPEQHEALGLQLRAVVDDAPEASVVIVHGNGAEAHHEPTQAVLDDVARHGQARGVVVHRR